MGIAQPKGRLRGSTVSEKRSKDGRRSNNNRGVVDDQSNTRFQGRSWAVHRIATTLPARSSGTECFPTVTIIWTADGDQ